MVSGYFSCWACQPCSHFVVTTCLAPFWALERSGRSSAVGPWFPFWWCSNLGSSYTLSPFNCPQVFELGLFLEVEHLWLMCVAQRATWRSAIGYNLKKTGTRIKMTCIKCIFITGVRFAKRKPMFWRKTFHSLGQGWIAVFDGGLSTHLGKTFFRGPLLSLPTNLFWVKENYNLDKFGWGR